MNRKGIFDVARKTIFWMFLGFVLSIILFGFAFIISSYKAKLVNVPGEVKVDLIASRFTNSAECFAFVDSRTGRVNIGIVDLSKFVQEQMDGCYMTDPKVGHQDYNFKLSLGDVDLRTNNYFDITHYTLVRDVLVWDGNSMVEGTLTIYVQEHVSRSLAEIERLERVRNPPSPSPDFVSSGAGRMR